MPRTRRHGRASAHAARRRARPGERASATSWTSAASASRAISIPKRRSSFYEPGYATRRMGALSVSDHSGGAAQDPRRASAGLSGDAFGGGTMSVPIDDGNCFACGPENPIGHRTCRFEPDDEGVRARVTLGPQFQGWRRHRARRHRDGAARRSDGARRRLCRPSRRHGQRQRALSQAGSAGRTARHSRPRRVAAPQRARLWRPACSTPPALRWLEGEGKFVSMGPLDAAERSPQSGDARNPSHGEDEAAARAKPLPKRRRKRRRRSTTAARGTSTISSNRSKRGSCSPAPR